MNISLGTCTDAVDKLDKTFSAGLTIDCKLKSQTSIIDPTVIITAANTVIGYNYAYIADWHRYYYIRDISSVNNDIWEVTMHVDVLKSFSNGIYNSPCIISKNANNYNLYLNDPNYKCLQDDNILKIPFPNGFDGQTACYIMALIGDKVAST